MTDAAPEALRLAHALDGGKLIDDSTEWADTLHAAADELRRLHARVQDLERGAAQWQPIETAPKDGPILLRSKKGRVADGMWIAATDTRGGWAWALIHQEPTHWMPLPPEPDRARSAQGESK